MSYTALYRRYRPQTFGALIGQEHVGRVLAAAMRRGEPTHAYLFCGPRGTGKTSAARILARAINCQNPLDSGDPCGSCPACQRALNGESLDIVEIDGASNRGIDEIRVLRERVRYAPAQDKRKVYIIDEVHMLTTDAFNALLKTLEEPPEHVVFILATTEPHKLPLTVLSRCQRFDFHRIGDEDICRHLMDVAEQEHIPLQPEAAALLTRKAEGGMRDAVSLLDQCAAAAQGRVDLPAVTAILGVVDRAFIENLLELLLQRDAAQAIAQVEQMANSGKDLRQALFDLQEALRDGLLAAMTGNSPHRPEEYLGLLTALADLDNRLRYALSPRITLELALIRACAPSQPPRPVVAPAASATAPATAPASRPAANPATPASRPAAAPAVSATAPASRPGTAPAAAQSAEPVAASAASAEGALLAGVAAPVAAAKPKRSRAKAADPADPLLAPASPGAAVPPPASPPVAAPGFPSLTEVAAAEPSPSPQPVGPVSSLAELMERWPDFLALLDAKNGSLASLLLDAKPIALQGSQVRVDLSPETAPFLSDLTTGNGKELIERLLAQAAGCRLSLDLFLGQPRESIPAAEPEEPGDLTPVEQSLF